MSYVILKPEYVAPECFLAEARNWVAHYRFPLQMLVNDSTDFRFDRENQEEYEAHYMGSYEFEFDEFECDRIGIPINPEIEALASDWPTLPPDHYEKMIQYVEGEEEKKKMKDDAEKSKLYHERLTAWGDHVVEIEEVGEAKLFVALKDGKVRAHGRKLLDPDPDKNYDAMEEKGIRLFDIEHEEIPAKFWRNDAINWEDSMAKTATCAYVHIYVNTDELFSIFPPPAETSTKAVKVIAGNYVLDADTTNLMPPKSRAGRPSQNWSQFSLEVHKRFTSGSVPQKQEAFIAQMQEWCKKNWGTEPGRSTILEKVKPYYDHHGNKS